MTNSSATSHRLQKNARSSKPCDIGMVRSLGIIDPHVKQVMRGMFEALKIKSGKAFEVIVLAPLVGLQWRGRWQQRRSGAVSY